MLNVVAATRTAAAKAGKKAQRDVQDAEEDRNLSWAFEEAQMRRARMRGEVKTLVDQYAEGADERRQREEAIKEERRRRRQAEKEREEELQARLAVELAEQYDAESARAVAPTAATEGQVPAQLVAGGKSASPNIGLSPSADPASPVQSAFPTDQRGNASPEGLHSPETAALESTVPSRALAAIETVAGSTERLHLDIKGSATTPSSSGLAIKGAAQSVRLPDADAGDLERGHFFGGDAAALAPVANDVNPPPIDADGPVDAAALDALRALQGYASDASSPAPSGTASGHETGQLESDDEISDALPRSRASRGRGASPPRREASMSAATLARNESPELQEPPPNQEQQQQRDTPRAGQKRTTRSSVAGASPTTLAQEAVVDEERPSKRLKESASVGSSKTASRAPSPAIDEEGQPSQSSARSGSGRGRAKRGGASRSRGGRKVSAPAQPPPTITIHDSSDDDVDGLA